jgi:hypothetical protein
MIVVPYREQGWRLFRTGGSYSLITIRESDLLRTLIRGKKLPLTMTVESPEASFRNPILRNNLGTSTRTARSTRVRK